MVLYTCVKINVWACFRRDVSPNHRLYASCVSELRNTNIYSPRSACQARARYVWVRVFRSAKEDMIRDVGMYVMYRQSLIRLCRCPFCTQRTFPCVLSLLRDLCVFSVCSLCMNNAIHTPDGTARREPVSMVDAQRAHGHQKF